MNRALNLLAALFATAAVLLFGCIVLVAWHIIPEFAKLSAHRKEAALLGLMLGYGTMFTIVYAQTARLIWRRTRWGQAMLFAGASFFGFPVGPVLGLAALVLLTRPGVKARFEAGDASLAK